MRKPRVGEAVYRCGAYRFPHRFTGGSCRGEAVVLDHWDRAFGGGQCRDCLHLDEQHGAKSCQVVVGAEDPRHCPVWQAFVHTHEIKLGSRYA